MSLALAAFGLAAILLAGWSRAMNRKAAAWPEVGGEIVRSSLEYDPHDSDRDSLTIVYRYSVGGIPFESSRASYSFRPVSRERRLRDYPVGRKVTVFYDPADPGRAVLERGASLA